MKLNTRPKVSSEEWEALRVKLVMMWVRLEGSLRPLNKIGWNALTIDEKLRMTKLEGALEAVEDIQETMKVMETSLGELLEQLEGFDGSVTP